jgi:hypothetical protein
MARPATMAINAPTVHATGRSEGRGPMTRGCRRSRASTPRPCAARRRVSGRGSCRDGKPDSPITASVTRPIRRGRAGRVLSQMTEGAHCCSSLRPSRDHGTAADPGERCENLEIDTRNSLVHHPSNKRIARGSRRCVKVSEGFEPPTAGTTTRGSWVRSAAMPCTPWCCWATRRPPEPRWPGCPRSIATGGRSARRSPPCTSATATRGRPSMPSHLSWMAQPRP